MGMDVYGINPSSERGEYFRANVWYWRPLWVMIQNLYPDLAQKVPHAQSNDGDGLESEDTLLLVSKMKTDLDSGVIEQYVNDYEEERINLPQQDCEFCHQTGYRLWPQEDGTVLQKQCNSCKGTKKVDAWESSYPMDLELVKQFYLFLADSGGFKIC